MYIADGIKLDKKDTSLVFRHVTARGAFRAIPRAQIRTRGVVLEKTFIEAFARRRIAERNKAQLGVEP
jgi:hypothetical protein